MPTKPGVCGSKASTERVSELYSRTALGWAPAAGLAASAAVSATGLLEAPDDGHQRPLPPLQLLLEFVRLGAVDLSLETSKLLLERLQQDTLFVLGQLDGHVAILSSRTCAPGSTTVRVHEGVDSCH